METIDWIALTLGLIWGTVMFILWRRNKPKLWPRIFGIGAGVYMFVLLMTGSMLLRPISEFVDYTITNFLLSLPAGIVAYFSARKIARNMAD
jgi:hypothetical protein